MKPENRVATMSLLLDNDVVWFHVILTVVPLPLLSWLITRLTRVHGRYIEPHGFINQVISGW